VASYLLQPDSVGTCCDCPTRSSPCDDCVEPCVRDITEVSAIEISGSYSWRTFSGSCSTDYTRINKADTFSLVVPQFKLYLETITGSCGSGCRVAMTSNGFTGLWASCSFASGQVAKGRIISQPNDPGLMYVEVEGQSIVNCGTFPTWNALVIYNINDIVNRSGSIWQSTKNNNLGNDPSSPPATCRPFWTFPAGTCFPNLITELSFDQDDLSNLIGTYTSTSSGTCSGNSCTATVTLVIS